MRHVGEPIHYPCSTLNRPSPRLKISRVMESVRRYVLNQEEHHRAKSFQEEYVEMLKRGLVEYDDSYLW
jgi:hypothetical protein